VVVLDLLSSKKITVLAYLELVTSEPPLTAATSILPSYSCGTEFPSRGHHAGFGFAMPLQFELAQSYRRITVDPVLPSVTVGALAGTIQPNVY
jgi:hypothetical protein